MSSKSIFEKLFPKKRRGSAIILTLAILSLMLIIAMIFSFEARSGVVASENHTKLIRARLLNESCVTRALSLLTDTVSSDGTPRASASAWQISMRDNHFFLAPGAMFKAVPNSAGTEMWASRRYFMTIDTTFAAYRDGIVDGFSASLPTQTGTDSYTPTYPLRSDESIFGGAPDPMAWIKVYGKQDLTDWGSYSVSSGSDSVVGALAYLIVDNTGFLDPTQISYNPSRASGTAMTEIGYSSTGSSIASADFTAYKSPEVTSYSELFAASGNVPTDRIDLITTMFPGQLADSEVYWGPSRDTADSMAQDTELLPRIDVTTLSTYSIQELFNLFMTGDTETSPTAAAFDGSDTKMSSPWLQRLAADSGVNSSDMKTVRRAALQLALNIKDYTDADENPSIAWVDNTGAMTDLSGAFPNASPAGESVVYGIESAGGLAELICQVEATGYNAAPEVTINFNFMCSLVNPIGATGAFNSPSVTIEFDYTVDGASTPSGSGTCTISGGDFTSGGANVYYTASYVTSSLSAHPTNLFPLSAPSYRVESLEITKVTVANDMGAGSRTVRQYPMYANCTPNDYFTRWAWAPPVLYSANHTEYVHIKAVDPLFADRDLYEPDASDYWTAAVGDLNGSMDATAPTLDAAGGTYVDYTAATTKYADATCPNSDFTTIGELGRVHSPHTPNMSLRFWVDDPAADGEFLDACLLDMFTTIPAEGLVGRINVNGANSFAFKALLDDVGFSNAQEDQAVTNLLNANGTTGGKPFIYRGEICNMFKNTFGASVYPTPGDDDTVDDYISRFIQLTTTRYGYFSMVCTSQSLRDLGVLAAANPLVSDEDVVQYDPLAGKYARVDSQQKILLLCARDCWTGDVQVIRKEILED